MTRRECREHLFCLVFQREFHAEDEFEVQQEIYFDKMDVKEQSDQEMLSERMTALVSKLPEIDVYIEKYAKGWEISRIGKAELALLRLAVFEALFDEEVPVGVAINEAVELAKKYGDDNAPKFINGILGKIVNE